MKTLDLKKITTFYGIGVAAIGLLILGFQSFAIVEPGEVGVKITLGKTHRNYLDQGFHLKLPFITKVKTLSIAQQSLVLENLDGSSSEGNNIFLDTQLTYSLKPSEVVDFYINYKSINNFQDNFLSNIVKTEAKSVLVRRNLQKTIAERGKIDNEIGESVFSALEEYPEISPKRVQVQDLDFADGVIAALEQKEVAQQKAQEASYRLQEAQKLAEAEVAKAEGQAKSQRLLAEALQIQGGELSLRRQELENQQRFIEAWEKGGSQMPMILNTGSESTTPFIMDLGGMKGQ